MAVIVSTATEAIPFPVLLSLHVRRATAGTSITAVAASVETKDRAAAHAAEVHSVEVRLAHLTAEVALEQEDNNR